MPSARVYTVRDIFLAGGALLSQGVDDMDTLAEFAPMWVNIMLAEALPYENMRRRHEGDAARPELITAPHMEDLDSVVPYDDEICRVALAYGMASQLFLDDEEDYRHQDFRGRFIAALRDTVRLSEESVRDVYA